MVLPRLGVLSSTYENCCIELLSIIKSIHIFAINIVKFSWNFNCSVCLFVPCLVCLCELQYGWWASNTLDGENVTNQQTDGQENSRRGLWVESWSQTRNMWGLVAICSSRYPKDSVVSQIKGGSWIYASARYWISHEGNTRRAAVQTLLETIQPTNVLVRCSCSAKIGSSLHFTGKYTTGQKYFEVFWHILI